MRVYKWLHLGPTVLGEASGGWLLRAWGAGGHPQPEVGRGLGARVLPLGDGSPRAREAWRRGDLGLSF